MFFLFQVLCHCPPFEGPVPVHNQQGQENCPGDLDLSIHPGSTNSMGSGMQALCQSVIDSISL